MAPASISTHDLWLVVAVLAVGTFTLRLSFIQINTWVDAFPSLTEPALRFIPAAVLAALVVPDVLTLEGVLAG